MDDAELGARLREVRRERRLALAEVESMSGREFKASVLGAYERGERQISVARLGKLVAIYDITLPEFLADEGPSGSATKRRKPGPTRAGGVSESMVDVGALERFEEAESLPAAVERFAEGVRDRHREPGHSFAMRDDEVLALASALRRAIFEIERVLLDLDRRGARAMYP